MTNQAAGFDAIQRLTRDLAKASVSLSDDEVRFLVDYYYIAQEERIRAEHQVRTLRESGEPHAVIGWLSEQSDTLESQIKRALGAYAAGNELGQWSLAICGIGPVIAAGLLAHIDITKAPTVGHIWRFAGLDPTMEWKKGQKRPWNASLKTLCWKIGGSFVKVKGNKADIYGKFYDDYKAKIQEKNARGEYAENAAKALKKKPDHKQAAIYKTGKLPAGHLDSMARRYTTKLFLAHYHAAAYRIVLKQEPPKPYAIAILGHAHEK